MSDAATVRPHLLRWFDSRRVVFWHDPDGQYAADLDGLDLPGVQTIRVANNEFAIKNRLLHDEPDGQVPRLPLGPGAERHRRTGCSTWSWPTGSSPPTAPRWSRRISV